jgi:hypothetical protein
MKPIKIAILLSVLFSSIVFAGPKNGMGGGGYAAEFQETAKLITTATKAKTSGSIGEVQRPTLKTPGETTTDKLRDSLGVEGDAVDTSSKGLIRVNQQHSFVSGPNDGGGGDGYAAEFIETAKSVAAAAKPQAAVLIEKLQRAFLTTQVETTTDELRDSLGFERDAINSPSRGLIQVNRKRWSALSQQQKQMLSIHEYLGILGVDDLTYKVSAPLVSAGVTHASESISNQGDVITLDSGNIKSFSIRSSESTSALLSIEFLNGKQQAVEASGKVEIISPYGDIKSRDYSCKLNGREAVMITESLLPEAECALKRSFTINYSINSGVSLLEVLDFLEITKNGEIQEIADGGVTINNNQSIHGGNANGGAVSTSAVLNNSAGLKSAQAQAGISSSNSAAHASTSTNNNRQNATNVGINSVKSCKMLTPVIRMQYKNNIITNLTLDTKSKLIPCP